VLRFAVLLVIAIGLAWAQAPTSLEIRGSVRELGSDRAASLPVEGAEINLIEFVPVGATPTRKPVATAYTDRLGGFLFNPDHAGDYWVEAKKDGYTVTPEYGIAAKLDQVHSSSHPDFTFMRPGSVTGRIVDDDGKPIAGQKVVVHKAAGDFIGIQMGGADFTALTGPDGVFSVTGVTPGAYTVVISSQMNQNERIKPQFSPGDLEEVDQDVAITYWPGGGTHIGGSILVGPGGATGAGEIRVRKSATYRVHISLPKLECAKNEKLGLRVLGTNEVTVSALRPFSCTNDFLVTHLQPGMYSLMVNRDASAEWAAAGFDISNKNLEVTLGLQAQMELQGRVIAVEGSSLPPFNTVQVHASSEAVSPKSATPDSEGKFAFANLRFPRHEITVQGLGEKYYIKEIRLNGAALANGVAILSGPSNQVEIVIDDQPGTFSGTVTDGNDLAADAIVQLYQKVPQLNALSAVERVLKTVRSDSQGRFQFRGLVPGEYRIMARPASVRDEPAASVEEQKQLTTGARSIRVERGGTLNATLPLSRPAR
jgi:hypothetical protein